MSIGEWLMIGVTAAVVVACIAFLIQMPKWKRRDLSETMHRSAPDSPQSIHAAMIAAKRTHPARPGTRPARRRPTIFRQSSRLRRYGDRRNP